MKQWVTEIKAIDPVNPERGIITYAGPEVPGNTHQEAEQYCQENGLGYCKVLGTLEAEFPQSFAPFCQILGNEN
jgi:hypothetical protein